MEQETEDTATQGRHDLSCLPQYQWPPLKDQSYRRLIWLHSARNLEDDIIVSISQYAPNACPDYNALSYYWENSARVREIMVVSDGVDPKEDAGAHRLSIHKNLFLALRRLRDTHHDRLLWTDFLCINQDDTIEKNEQV